MQREVRCEANWRGAVIVVVGISHRTAPIAVREKLAVGKAELPEVLESLCASPVLGEAMIVSTCNRLEVVAAVARGADAEAAARTIQTSLGTRANGIEPHLYTYLGGEAVRHLFRVASSLDSLVLGEPQILGQVKDAFEVAQSAGTVGVHLRQVLPRALRAAKRVRTETNIGGGLVSVPSVAVDLTQQIFGDLSKCTVTLIGSGEMAETVAKLLRQSGSKILVVGRTPERVRELCDRVGGEGRSWDQLSESLIAADVVISSTSAPHYVVTRELVKSIRRPRKGRSLFFIDLAVPRDIDPECESVDNVFVYNVDDFSRVVAETQNARLKEAEHAEEIIKGAVRGYDRWAEAAQVTPLIVAMRAAFGGVLNQELERSFKGKLKHLGEDERRSIEKMLDAALNKLLHTPTQRLREAATAGDDGARLEELVTGARELFDLGEALDAEQPLQASDRRATESE
ncbi:MAG: glutamyl-tRNA reductase [Polyangiaceae bacterium]